MTLGDVRIEYRTLRIGFCVPYGDVESVAKAAKINTLLWGGVYNPILPIGDPDGLDHLLMKLFQVDVLVPVGDSPEIKAFIEKYKWARFPLMFHSEAIYSEDSFQRGKKTVNVLDVSQILRKVWDKDFRFLKSNHKTNCALPTWKSSDPAANLLTLIFGQYPDENFTFKYPEKYKKTLRAEEIKIAQTKPIPKELSLRVSPMVLTEHEIKSYGGRRVEAGIYVGDPKDFMDLVNFWNIRASGSHLTFLPTTNTVRFLPYVQAHIGHITRPSEFDNKPVVHVWFKGDSEENFKRTENVIKPLQTKKKIMGMSPVSIHNWNGLNIVPNYNLLGEATTIASVSERDGRPRIAFQLLEKPTLKEQERTFRKQYFIVSVRPSVGLEYPEYTTKLPILPDLNEWYARQMVFDPFSLRAVKSYLGPTVALITEVDADTIEINPINKFEIIKRVLERAAITAEKSGAGLIAERLIALTGGVMGSGRIFKITGVRRFIEETDPLHQKTKGEITEKINDNGSFKNFENEFGLKGRAPLTTDDVFETLIERNLIQTGVEVRCSKCGIKSWINLKMVDENYDCEYCHEKTKFVDSVEKVTQKADGEIKKFDGTRWSYRLNGLMAKSDNQQGAIPVLLTLMHLANRLHTGSQDHIYSTALELKFTEGGKEEKAETDLVVLDMADLASKRDIEILIGECKTGGRITKAQIDRLIKVKKLIETSGIRCYVAFVKTKNTFTPEEITQFKRLYALGIKPLLFTSNELERWWDEYKNFKADNPTVKLPYEHPFTFGELADNSACIYKLY